MKKVLLSGLLALMAAMLFVPAVASDHEGEKKISVHGEVRARWEYSENFTDFRDSDDGDFRDSFDFMPYRVRVGVKGEFAKNVSAYVEIQNHGAFGDSFPIAVEQSPEDPVLQNLRENFLTNETILYQGYMDLDEIGGSNFSLRIGRQEHTIGNELLMGDADWYNGRSFDGIRGMFDFDGWDLDVFFYEIVERDVAPGIADAGSDIPVNGGSDDSILGGVTADFMIGDTEQSITPYVLYFKNGNEFGVLQSKLNFYTVGLLYDRPMGDDNAFDWSAELVMQSGELGPNGETDISTMAFEGWFGYSWGDDARHRVHLGALMLGDGDDPDDWEAFIPLFGDTHERLGMADLFSTTSTAGLTGFNRSGLSTMHNVTNINLGYDFWNGPHHFALALHQFTLTEDFGFDEDDVGQEVDLMYGYKYSHNVAIEVGVANFEPGDLSTALGGADDAVMRGWAQARLRF